VRYIGKRWLKRKGCKNVAIVSYEGRYEDGETFIREYVQPYYKGREFRYISPEIDMTKERLEMRNCYVTEEGIFTLLKPTSTNLTGKKPE
jgi:hypothetical protein